MDVDYLHRAHATRLTKGSAVQALQYEPIQLAYTPQYNKVWSCIAKDQCPTVASINPWPCHRDAAHISPFIVTDHTLAVLLQTDTLAPWTQASAPQKSGSGSQSHDVYKLGSNLRHHMPYTLIDTKKARHWLCKLNIHSHTAFRRRAENATAA